MGINRYTNLTPSTYKPLTSQEIMMVPLAMRAQHDQSKAQISAGLDELDKLNSLDLHTPELTERKNMLISKIDALSSDLANQGFSNDMTDKVLKLNRGIKNELGPQGRLGQINQAYQVYGKNFQEFKEDNKKKNWSDAEEKLNWNEHIGTYQGYDEQGNITNIGSLSAANKVEIDEKMKTLTDIMGDSEMASAFMNGDVQFVPRADGAMATYNTKTGQSFSTNKPQVISMLKAMHAEIIDPTSDLYKSNKYRGRSLQTAMGMSGDLARSAIDMKSSRTNERSGSLDGYENFRKIAREAAEKDGSIELLDVATESQDYKGTIGNAIATINKYAKTAPTTMDERVEHSKALEAKKLYDETLKKPSTYMNLEKDGTTFGKFYAKKLGYPSGTSISLNGVKNAYDNSKNKFLSKFKKGTKEYELAVAYLNGDPKNLISKNIAARRDSSGKTKELETVSAAYRTIVNDKQEAYSNYSNDVFKNHNTYSAGYMPVIAGKDDSNAKSEFKQSKDIIKNGLSDIAIGSQNGAALTRITTTKGTPININGKDAIRNREEIGKVLQNAKDLEVIALKPGGQGVLPSVRLKVDLNDIANENSLEGWSGDDEYGGEKGVIIIDLTLDDFTSTKGATNIGTNSAPQHLFNIIQKYGKGPAINNFGAKQTGSIMANKKKYGR
jgi:hypothetical protein